MTAVLCGANGGFQDPAVDVCVGHSLNGRQCVLSSHEGHIGGGTRHLAMSLTFGQTLDVTNLLSGGQQVVRLCPLVDDNPVDLPKFPEILRPFQQFWVCYTCGQAGHKHQVGLNNSRVGVGHLPPGGLVSFHLLVLIFVFFAGLYKYKLRLVFWCEVCLAYLYKGDLL